MSAARLLLRGLMLMASAVAAFGFVADDNEWPNGTITYQVRLGGASSGALIDGATSWTTVAQAAMAEWNAVMNDVQLAGVEAAVGGEGDNDRVNDLFFSSTAYGDAFGAQTLAVTLNVFEGFSTPLPRVEADIVFNNKSDLNWNSYRGARRNDVDDLRRVLIHELGHALGLDHPDGAGQSVDAIMNAFVSDIDTIVTDDINGVQSLYGGTGTGGGGGGGGSGGGSSGDAFESDDTAGAATSISNGATQSHSIHEIGDKDWVTFTLPTGATDLRIETSGASGDTEIFLFGPNSSTNLVTSNDDGGSSFFSLITRSAPDAGSYFVRVEEFSNNATIDAYTIAVSWTESSGGGGGSDAFESDDSANAAAAISNGQTQARSIQTVGDLDWVTFTVGADGGSDFVIETDGPSGDTILTLFGPNSSTTELASNDDINTGGGDFFSRISLVSISAGTYHARVEEFNNNGTISEYTLSVSWTESSPVISAAKLSNLSVRAKTGGQFGTLILGFATSTSAKEVLIRGIGPTLGDFGVPGPISDPKMELFSGTVVIDAADDWVDETNAATISSRGAALGAFAPNSSLEAILLRSVDPSPYTVQVTDFSGDTGEVLIEAYDADALSAPGRLTNLSTRTEVGGAAGILTAGFVVAGTGDLTLLIRGVGPTLAGFGVAGAIGDPTLQVLDSNQQVVGSNDDWNSSDAAAKRSTAVTVGGFALLEDSLDAALLITLPPGPYTVQMNGFNGASGNGLVEIYEVQ